VLLRLDGTGPHPQEGEFRSQSTFQNQLITIKLSQSTFDLCLVGHPDGKPMGSGKAFIAANPIQRKGWRNGQGKPGTESRQPVIKPRLMG
jgi:hypothetical protein